MSRELGEKRCVERRGDRWVYHYSYECELSEDEIKKNLGNIERNLARLRDDLKALEAGKELEDFKQRMLSDYEVKKEALKNFDKYFLERLMELKKSKDDQRKAIEFFVKNFDKHRENQLNKLKAVLADRKRQILEQIKDNEANREVYERAGATAAEDKEGSAETAPAKEEAA